MKMLLYSDLARKRELQGWHRVGHNINYCEHKYRTYNSLLERDINYFELDFQLVCQQKQKKILIFSFLLIGIFLFG